MMPEKRRLRVFHGTAVHSTASKPLCILENCVIGVKDQKIAFVANEEELETVQEEFKFRNNDVTTLTPSQFLMPGLIDSHIHGSQYSNAGLCQGISLLQWLNQVTFPTEQKFHDCSFAEDVYTKAVHRTLKSGTTTASYFGTIHVNGCLKLAEVAERLGQRAFVGKVSMDMNSPVYYVEKNLNEAVMNAERFVTELLHKRKNSRVQPIITPRFAISCSGELMKELAHLANRYQLNIQTHISENRSECDFTKSVFPEAQNYADVYDKAGLLTEKTVLAHAIHLSEPERRIIHSRGSGISHCPNSNMSLHSGLCNTRQLLSDDINVGLGTDVSGGYHPSVLDAIRHAVQTSNLLKMNPDDNYKPIHYPEAFRMATLGSAEVLAIDNKVGNFEVGKEFDALLIDTATSNSPFDIFENDGLEQLLTKFLFVGDDRNIKEVYVAGDKVMSNA